MNVKNTEGNLSPGPIEDTIPASNKDLYELDHLYVLNSTTLLSSETKSVENFEDVIKQSNIYYIQDKIQQNYYLLISLRFLYDHELTGIKRYQFDEEMITKVYDFFLDNYDPDQKKIFRRIIREHGNP